MIERRRLPGCGVVTGLARLREACRRVAGIFCVLEIFQVARRAGRVRGRQIEIPIHVASRAGDSGVRPCKREASCRVIEVHADPVVQSVAPLASGGEPCSHVVRIAGLLELICVAGIAGGR